MEDEMKVKIRKSGIKRKKQGFRARMRTKAVASKSMLAVVGEAPA